MADWDNRDPRRSIDVTKPQKQQQQTSNIDASRVSAYTLREQASLEKLKRQVGSLDQRENRASRLKTIIAIVLVLILIALAIIFVVVIGKNNKVEEHNTDIRLSMQLQNKDALSIVTDTGQEALRKISPGDRIPLSAYIRNSSNISGDILTSENQLPQPIYVRFRLVLILDYEERYDIMVPTLSDRWYKYNAEDESHYIGNGGVKEDDHYYYYVGALSAGQPEELFSEILFDGNVITCEDGGKYGQIQVHVDSTHASIVSVTSRTVWPTAPEVWRVKMMALAKGNENTESAE